MPTIDVNISLDSDGDCEHAITAMTTMNSVNVVVNNVAPSPRRSIGLTADFRSAEGGTTTLTGTVTEPGADTVTLLITWGDETEQGTQPQTVVIAPGGLRQRRFRA